MIDIGCGVDQLRRPGHEWRKIVAQHVAANRRRAQSAMSRAPRSLRREPRNPIAGMDEVANQVAPDIALAPVMKMWRLVIAHLLVERAVTGEACNIIENIRTLLFAPGDQLHVLLQLETFQRNHAIRVRR